jgi:POT family proton-dependent oligopeptide transporter
MFKKFGSEPDLAPLNKIHYLAVIAGIVLLSFISSELLQHIVYGNMVIFGTGGAIIALYLKETFKSHGLERAKMLVAFVLFIHYGYLQNLAV